MRYLVTGGLGYAGAWFTSALAAAGHETFVLSRKTGVPALHANPLPGRARPSDDALPYTLIQADLEKQGPEELAALLPDGLDVVIHAASFNESFAQDYGRRALIVNALGTRNLLDALIVQNTNSARPLPLVLYISTVHVYGASHGHITENSPLRPRNDYALTHLFGEEYCRMFMRVHNLPLIVIRLSNGYGAPKTADSTKWYLLLHDLCRNAVSRGRIVLRSDPAIRRDFIWLGDAAAAVKALSGRPDLSGGIFNLSSGASLRLDEVARRVCAVASRFFRKDVPLVLEGEQYSASEPSFLHVDNAAIRAALNLCFHDRMEEEILALLSLPTAGQTVGLP